MFRRKLSSLSRAAELLRHSSDQARPSGEEKQIERLFLSPHPALSQRERESRSLLLPHTLAQNVLQLERVRHPEQRCRTQSERPAFGVRRELDPIAERVRIRERRLHARGHRLNRFLLFLWQ